MGTERLLRNIQLWNKAGELMGLNPESAVSVGASLKMRIYQVVSS